MSEEFKIEPAKRGVVAPLIGLFGKSGSGKTLTGLKLMRGIIGVGKRIVVVDSENKRASHFADYFPGYSTIDLQPPFSPERYLAAYRAAEAQADGVVVDSASHEWNGEGGCLQMLEKWLDEKCGNDWGKRDRMKMMAWGRVTPQHEMFVAALMRAKIPVILCFRAKDKVVMEKKEEPNPGEQRDPNDRGGKTKITTDEDAPIQRKDMIHEMTMAFALHEEEDGGGYFTVRKRGVPTLYQAVMAVDSERLGEEHGRSIAKWCNNPSVTSQAPAPAPKAPVSERDTLVRKIWDIGRKIHGCPEKEKDKATIAAAKTKLQQWLWDEGLCTDTQFLGEMPPAELQQTIDKITAKLNQ